MIFSLQRKKNNAESAAFFFLFLSFFVFVFLDGS